MPNDPGGDALHLALASVHRVNVLLTWNCQHLANPSKMEHIRLVNYELGLPMPLLTTPLNYLSGDESNPMPNDEISEIRRIRHEISQECGHDIRKIAAYFRQVEEELKNSGEFRFEEQSCGHQAVCATSDAGTPSNQDRDRGPDCSGTPPTPPSMRGFARVRPCVRC